MRNLKCESLDPEFAKFDICELTQAADLTKMNIILRLFKVPVTNWFCTAQIVYQKSLSVPLLNNTWDICDFMRKRKRGNVFSRIYAYLGPYTNLNHSCPFNHDIYVQNLTIMGKKTLVPMPNGNYRINFIFLTDGKKRFLVNFILGVKN
ncbi:uncharacterized protein LOC131996028 [Stomoxys calcitrans]|uniref:uncharacterized protein LOC131996028 n=1 Tax=Stomoxys calcitrans TaxID=35570 RepID=UPI0027E29A3C|nr:uncharacterized protein LOC131996028 [Stomoxys calcitrans]